MASSSKVVYERLELRWPVDERNAFVDFCGRVDVSMCRALRAAAAALVSGDVTLEICAPVVLRPGERMRRIAAERREAS